MTEIEPLPKFTLASFVLLAALAPLGCGGSQRKPAAEVRSQDIVDPYLWLEEIEGDKALSWVKEKNRDTDETLRQYAEFDALYREALAILDAPGRLPELSPLGTYVYNHWRDASHPLGTYRRSTIASLRKGAPAWETVVDLDELAAKEGKRWVFKDMKCLSPEYRRCLLFLSQGGGDAVVAREFDLGDKTFAADGFTLERAKSDASWLDQDHLLVASDFGPGSLTAAGYPRVVKLWQRGQAVDQAKLLFEGKPGSVAVWIEEFADEGGHVHLVEERMTFWNGHYHQWHDGRLVALQLPAHARVQAAFRDGLLVLLFGDWTVGKVTYREGSLVYAKLEALRSGAGTHELVFAPGERQSIEAVHRIRGHVLVHSLDNIRSRLFVLGRTAQGAWSKKQFPLPAEGALSVANAQAEADDLFVVYEDFTTPPTLYYAAGANAKPKQVMRQPESFDESRFEVTQHVAKSKDGTEVPYWMVAAKGLTLSGENPTHVFSYGGFRNSLLPSYSGSYESLHGVYGKLWLERGGVFVLANIRGGNEFGPTWHRAAIKENRPRAFEDLEAVATDLITRRVTSPHYLGIEGRSNGGLLVAATMLRRPDLYSAAVAGMPLLDMRRYDKLHAGTSWEAEYGDPDVAEEWEFLSSYSPYQSVREDADYPSVLFYTSTRDDRVHPGHARKMAAKMETLGYDVFYYENVEGGHHGSSTNEQLAYRLALVYSFLWTHLK